MATDASRRVPAPGLRETADIWFDTGRDPEVAWDDTGTVFRLLDPSPGTASLLLLRLDRPVAEPRRVAEVLADGLAACDFPPTGDGAEPGHVVAALRAGGLQEVAEVVTA